MACTHLIPFALAAAIALPCAGAALAESPAKPSPKSVYTSFDAKTCKHKKGSDEEDYGSWTCPGHGRHKVLLSAGDQRMFVAFGRPREKSLAATETFPGFNDVYEGRVEWRLARSASGRTEPFATILRWNVMTGADIARATGPSPATGRILVVTRLGPGGSCHVGYVDARLNPDANALARKLADERARDFKCGVDKPQTIGRKDPDIATPAGG